MPAAPPIKTKPISKVSSVLIRLDPDTHRVIKVGGSTHQILSYLAYSPDRAIKELKAGRDCYLDNFPGNLEAVRAHFAIAAAEQGDPVKRERGKSWRYEKPLGAY